MNACPFKFIHWKSVKNRYIYIYIYIHIYIYIYYLLSDSEGLSLVTWVDGELAIKQWHPTSIGNMFLYSQFCLIVLADLPIFSTYADALCL